MLLNCHQLMSLNEHLRAMKIQHYPREIVKILLLVYRSTLKMSRGFWTRDSLCKWPSSKLWSCTTSSPFWIWRLIIQALYYTKIKPCFYRALKSPYSRTDPAVGRGGAGGAMMKLNFCFFPWIFGNERWEDISNISTLDKLELWQNSIMYRQNGNG